MPELPKEYKAAVFESKGAPLTFKQVKLEKPKDGENYVKVGSTPLTYNSEREYKHKHFQIYEKTGSTLGFLTESRRFFLTVLVKVLACGVCHSDAAVQEGIFGNSFPIIPGHEIIGEVAAVPDSEKTWKEGQRVGGPWHGGHDGTCKACKRGLFQMCKNETINGVMRDGGYAEYVTLRTEAVVSVPEDIDPAEYCPILCAGITVFNSLRKQNITQGELVGVQGLGGLGHLAVQYANKMGYKVVAISSSADKEKFARDLGAHEYIDGSKGDVGEQLQKLGGAACIIFTAPNPKLIQPLMGGLGPLGKLLILAAAGPAEINTAAMIGNGLSVVAWPSGHALDSEEAIDFAMRHDVKCMVETFSLNNANEALKHMLSGKVRFRAVLDMTKKD